MLITKLIMIFFTHLFYSCVSPILLYANEACGSNKLKKCDQIQHRAMRFFLVVHKYAPILSLQGDMSGLFFLLIGMYLYGEILE